MRRGVKFGHRSRLKGRISSPEWRVLALFALTLAFSGGLIPEVASRISVTSQNRVSLSAPLKLNDCTKSIAKATTAIRAPSLKPFAPSAHGIANPTSPPAFNPPGNSILKARSTAFGGLNNSVAFPGGAPPDISVAAGPNHVLEMVNLAGLIFVEASSTLKAFPLISLLDDGNATTTNSTLTDPQAIFDSAAGTDGRWFATVLNKLPNSNGMQWNADLIIAVSQSNDPTGNWNVFVLVTGVNYVDQPRIGLNDDKLVISGFLLTAPLDSFVGIQIWVLNKNALISGMAAVNCSFYGPDKTVRKISPVQSYSSTPTAYVVGNVSIDQAQQAPGPQRSFNLYNITGVPGNAGGATMTLSSVTFVQPVVKAPFGVQPSGINLSVDNFGVSAVWLKGELWFSFADGCVPPNDGGNTRTCIRLTQLLTSSTSQPSVQQDFDLSGAGFYYFYPSLVVDLSGSLNLVFGFANGSVFPSLAITGQTVFDSMESLESPITLIGGSGSAPSTGTCSGQRCAAYGDYFGAAMDPSGQIWVAGEYVTSDSPWSTYVSGMIVLPPPCCFPAVGGGGGGRIMWM